MKHIFFLALSLCLIPLGMSAQALPFYSPDVVAAYNDARPWTFWYWMYGAVSRESIHADLVGIKDVGLGGCYLMPIRSSKERPEFGGDADALSPKFWSMVDYAFQQADSLGLDMGIHICDGFALAGGPWVTPEESMQKVVWTDTIVSGRDLRRGVTLRRPEAYDGYYKDIATYAWTVDRPQNDGWLVPVVGESGSISRNEKGVFVSKEPGFIVFDLGSRRMFRSLQVIPSGNNIQSQRLRVSVSDDGTNYRHLINMEPCRQGWQSTGMPFTYAVPATEARYVRFDWSPEGSEPGSEELDAAKWRPTLRLKNVLLSSETKIGQWEGKSGATWRIAPPTDSATISDADCVAPGDLKRLSLDGDRVRRKVSPDSWVRILRMGHTSTGQTNATAGGAKGLEVDKFSSSAVNSQITNWFGEFARRPHHEVVKFLHVDSWECGSQNWGVAFAERFHDLRGYDLLRWLPVYAGIPVQSAAKSEEVLRDIRQTINDLVNENFFTVVERRAHEMGMRVSQESIAPTFVADGIEHYKYADVPMGEFWLNSPTHDKPNDMLDAISGAHIYGKNIVQAEGFTEVRGVWNETPAMLKPLLDRNFALGMNKLFFHVNALNPWLDRAPGMTLDGIGLFFQRDNTWYYYANGLVDYITRCQRRLQSGAPVADIAVYTGDEMPARALTPDKLVPMLPGLFGADRVASEVCRLANEGNPITESPVGVFHGSGIFSLDGWVNALHGYHYDSMNKDVLMHADVLGGCLLGKYSVLVVPQKNLAADTRERIEQLRRAGVKVIDQPWREPTLAALGVEPDVILPDSMAFCHRTMGAAGDTYFLADQSGRARTVTASFRSAVGLPGIIYDPVADCDIVPTAEAFRNGRKEVTFSLPAYGSVFVSMEPAVIPVGERKPEQLVQSLALDGTWSRFFSKIDRPGNVTLPDDWSKDADEHVKYYSGFGFYTTTLTLKRKPGGVVRLALGCVGDVAKVFVNNIDCGTAWTSPYEVDITGALVEGENTIAIGIANTWRNALLGAERGTPPFGGIWTNARYRMKEKDLLPAGLFGPVYVNIYKGNPGHARRMERERQKAREELEWSGREELRSVKAVRRPTEK